MGLEKTYLGLNAIDKSLGGIRLNSSIAFAGGPGSGKTSMCITAVHNSLRNLGESVLYFTTKENANKVYEYAEEFGFDFQKFVKQNKLYIEEIRPIDVKQMIKNESIRIFELIQSYNAKKVVFDSLNYIVDAFPSHYERMTYSLKIITEITKHNCILLGTYDTSPKRIGRDILEYLVDYLFVLETNRKAGSIKRRLNIIKTRGSSTNKITFDYSIKKGGVAFTGDTDA